MGIKTVNKVFKWNPTILSKLIIRTVNNKFDFNLCVSGLRGTGKSTLCYQLARRIQTCPERIKGTYTFNPKKDILYTQKDVLKAMNERWSSIIFCDEAIAVAFNRDFYMEDQKKIIKVMNMSRDHQNIIFFCIPNFTTLDTQMKGMMKMRIHTIRRGYGIVQTPVKSIYSRDSWDNSNNEKIEREWSERGLKPKYQRLTTFRGVIKFKDLPPQHRQLYEEIKFLRRNQILIEEEEKENAKQKRILLTPIARQIAVALEEGNIKSREEFDKFAIVLGASPVDMVRRVREFNRERGVTTKLNDYFSQDEEKPDGDSKIEERQDINLSQLNIKKKDKEVMLLNRRPAVIPSIFNE